ncbi:ParA family protein [Pontibacter sp. G13]|uniref:ParA family protein n=1 Tax=Pontibacter sp. G13 TaxID=3074898 RepID=UPI002889FD40|nr:ParA family protein [Pontibacter sp. G13]WNJ21556.1 ParA family protein [Pontibacter sp. G13]
MIISIANFKGGVGKSTVTHNLGFALARRGFGVLMVDMDAQANLTMSCNVGFSQLDVSVYELMAAKAGKGDKQLKPEDAIFRFGDVDLIPASILLARADLDFSGAVNRERLLARALKDVVGEYDIVLLDCPPNLGLVTQNALAISDMVLIPTTAEFLPVKGVDIFIQGVQDFVEEIENSDLAIGGIIINMLNKSRSLTWELVNLLKDGPLGELVFESMIPVNVAISEAQAQGQTVYDYNPESKGAKAFEALADEFLKRFTNEGVENGEKESVNH